MTKELTGVRELSDSELAETSGGVYCMRSGSLWGCVGYFNGHITIEAGNGDVHFPEVLI